MPMRHGPCVWRGSFRLSGIFKLAQTCKELEAATASERRARGRRLVEFSPVAVYTVTELHSRGSTHCHVVSCHK